MTMPMFEGTEIKMGAKIYVLPTLGGKAYRVGKAFEKLKKVEEVMSEQQKTQTIHMDSETIGIMYELVHMALQRNYSEITVDEVEDGLDLDGVMKCFPLLVSQDSEKIKQGLAELAKNAQKQSTKKEK